jgi:hypothetical protein
MTTISADGATSTIYIQDISSAIQYRINSGTWNNIIFPATVVNTNIMPTSNILKVIFPSQITLNPAKGGASCFFNCGSAGIQIGNTSLDVSGNRAIIVIEGIGGYPGFISYANKDISNNNIYIYNLAVISQGSSSSNTGGWVCSDMFGGLSQNNYIINCMSNGIASGGGIVGANAAIGPSSLYIIGCYSSGIIGSQRGGIIGLNAAQQAGASCVIEQCWSEGSIFPNGGGIYGSGAGALGGSVSAQRCYSIGSMSTSSGGIYGFRAAQTNGTATAINCYSTGSIDANGGGIFGSNAGVNNGQCTATNCYTLGGISASGGGVFGASGSGMTAGHCYTAGDAAGSTGYIFAGSTTVPSTNYSEAANSSSGWKSSNANGVLQGIPPAGSIWANSGVNQPYELSAFGYTPYNRANIANNALVQNYAQSVVAGGTTIKAIRYNISGVSYSIVGGNAGPTITINAQTGAITTTTATPGGTYTIYVRSTGSYSITTFTLTVIAPPIPPPPVVAPLPVAPRPRPTGNVATGASASTEAARYRALAGGYQKGVRAPNADPSVLWNITGVYCPCPGAKSPL